MTKYRVGCPVPNVGLSQESTGSETEHLMYPFALHKGHQSKKALVWIFFLGLLVAGLCFFGYYKYGYIKRQKLYDRVIERAARRHCIDSRLLRAVIMQESGFRSNIRGTSGEVGLMQVRPDARGATQDWANYYRCPRPCPGLVSDPELNIEIGAWYLARALRYWRDYDDYIELALCEYNAGRSRVMTWKPVMYNERVVERITLKSTRAYVQGIMKKYRKLADKEGF